MREWIFAALLAVAGLSIVVGVATWSTGAAWCAAGAVIAGWAWLVFVYADHDEPSEPASPVFNVPPHPVPGEQ